MKIGMITDSLGNLSFDEMLPLIFIGLIGEYLARIFEEVKGRPLYLFKQKPHGRRARASAADDMPAPLRRSPLKVTFGPAVRSVDGHAPALHELARGVSDRAEFRLADAGADRAADQGQNGASVGGLPPRFAARRRAIF